MVSLGSFGGRHMHIINTITMAGIKIPQWKNRSNLHIQLIQFTHLPCLHIQHATVHNFDCFCIGEVKKKL